MVRPTLNQDQEKISYSPIALLVSILLGSGAGGVGVNYAMGDYKLQQLKEDININASEIKDLRNNIKALIQVQNECMTNSKILEYRLNNQEKMK